MCDIFQFGFHALFSNLLNWQSSKPWPRRAHSFCPKYMSANYTEEMFYNIGFIFLSSFIFFMNDNVHFFYLFVIPTIFFAYQFQTFNVLCTFFEIWKWQVFIFRIVNNDLYICLHVLKDLWKVSKSPSNRIGILKR